MPRYEPSRPWRPWYGTKRWQEKRAQQLRDEPLCRLCAEAGRTTPATVCDHMEPHRGDPDLFWNGETQSTCKACHDRHKQKQERTGHLPGSDADGMPLDPAHPWSG